MIFFFNLQGYLLEVSNLLGPAQLCWSVLLFPRMTRFHPWVMTHSGIIHGDEYLLNMCMCKHSTHIQALHCVECRLYCGSVVLRYNYLFTIHHHGLHGLHG